MAGTFSVTPRGKYLEPVGLVMVDWGQFDRVIDTDLTNPLAPLPMAYIGTKVLWPA